MELSGKNVCVVGTGISGMGAVGLLNEADAHVYLYDGNTKLEKSKVLEKLGTKKADIIIGEMPKEVLDVLDLAVISPGVPIDSDIVLEFNNAGIPVWGEIELAYQNSMGKLAAITGTNGKTTTTSLVGEIMKNTYKDVYVVGNIGTSYADVALDTTADTVTVAEISSFQLESAKDFHPDVTAVLNITPDHLNRHYTMENYTNVKMSIAKNQTKDQICVLNYDDEILLTESNKIPAKSFFYSSRQSLIEGVCLDGEDIVLRIDGEEKKVCGIHDMKLVGIHNVENVMAAVAISYFMGAGLDIIRDTIRDFKAVEHRIEYVTEKNGVIYYNDSKGTNTDASIKAIEAMTRPTVLIAGGYDKGCEFDDWVKLFDGTVKCVVLIGATSQKIADTAKKYNYDSIIFADTLEDAVLKADEQADSGDAVLLSPACASWDMFKSYEERGRMFKEFVNNL